MDACCLKEASGRCFEKNLESGFNFHFPFEFKCFSPSSFAPWLVVYKWSELLPTLDSHLPDGQKVKASPWPQVPWRPMHIRDSSGKALGKKRAEDKDRDGERVRSLGARQTNVHNELTLGMLSLVQTPSDNNLSRISQAKMDGHSRLYWAILLTTSGVATLGLLPPIALGLMEPVS